MISKKRHEALVRRVEELEKELREQKYRHQRLLEHLGLRELEIPAKSSSSKIVTKEEYEEIIRQDNESRERLRSFFAAQSASQFPFRGLL